MTWRWSVSSTDLVTETSAQPVYNNLRSSVVVVLLPEEAGSFLYISNGCSRDANLILGEKQAFLFPYYEERLRPPSFHLPCSGSKARTQLTLTWVVYIGRPEASRKNCHLQRWAQAFDGPPLVSPLRRAGESLAIQNYPDWRCFQNAQQHRLALCRTRAEGMVTCWSVLQRETGRRGG